MKTMAFFNEKGGVGKSTHTVLFASWLAYGRGKRVLVVDLEAPGARLQSARESELAQMEDPSSALSRYLETVQKPQVLWDVISPLSGVKKVTAEVLGPLMESLWRVVAADEYDYVIFDFPSGMTDLSPSFVLCGSGLVDLVAIPVDTEPVTRRCALNTAVVMKKNEVDVRMFWNNIPVADMNKDGYLDSGEEIFSEFGLEFLKTRIKMFAKARRNSEEKLFVRSTVCWPERYVQMNCPELPALYEEIVALLS